MPSIPPPRPHIFLLEALTSRRIEIHTFLTHELGALVCPHERVTTALREANTRAYHSAVLSAELPGYHHVAERLARVQPAARVVLVNAAGVARADAIARGWKLVESRYLARDLRAAYAHEVPTVPR